VTERMQIAQKKRKRFRKRWNEKTKMEEARWGEGDAH
jgi:hypothetical protein